MLMFSKQLNGLNEKEQEALIIRLALSDISQEPQFIEYITKKNKVFMVDSFEDLDNYNGFCINKILGSADWPLESCKEYLMNSLFNIDTQLLQHHLLKIFSFPFILSLIKLLISTPPSSIFAFVMM